MRSWDEYKRTMRAEDPIFDLARTGDLEGLRQLDLTPARLDAKNARGHSALMLAAYNGRHDVSAFLLERGATADSCDEAGSTVLMGAAFKGDVAMIDLLLSHGADPQARNLKNQTALDFALAFGRGDVAEYLKTKSNDHRRNV